MSEERRKGDRRIPPAVAQHMAEERSALMAQVETLTEWYSNALDTIRALEADRDRLKVIADNYSALNMDAQAELAALKAQPSAGVIPAHPGTPWIDEHSDTLDRLLAGKATEGDQMIVANHLQECDLYEDVYGQLCDMIEPHVSRAYQDGWLPASVVDSMRYLLDKEVARLNLCRAQPVVGGFDLDDVRGALASAHSAIVYQGQSVSYEYALRRVSKALHDLAAAPSTQQKESGDE